MSSRSLDDLSSRIRPQADALIATWLRLHPANKLIVTYTLRTQTEQDAAVASHRSRTHHGMHLPQPPDLKACALDVCPHLMHLKPSNIGRESWQRQCKIQQSQRSQNTLGQSQSVTQSREVRHRTLQHWQARLTPPSCVQVGNSSAKSRAFRLVFACCGSGPGVPVLWNHWWNWWAVEDLNLSPSACKAESVSRRNPMFYGVP